MSKNFSTSKYENCTENLKTWNILPAEMQNGYNQLCKGTIYYLQLA